MIYQLKMMSCFGYSLILLHYCRYNKCNVQKRKQVLKNH